MSITYGTVQSAIDTTLADAVIDVTGVVISSSSNRGLVCCGAMGNGSDIALTSVVVDPAGSAETMDLRINYYNNFGRIFIATLFGANITPGTVTVRCTWASTPTDVAWMACQPMTADGALSFGAASTATNADNTSVTDDGTGTCIDVFFDTNDTATASDADQTDILDIGAQASFYSGGCSYKTPAGSSTNMNWTGTTDPRHGCIHVAEAAAASGSVGQRINNGLIR